MAKHGKAWQNMAGGCKGEKFRKTLTLLNRVDKESKMNPIL